MSADLRIHLSRDRGVPVMVVAGELDLYTSPLLRDRGRELVDVALTAPPSTAQVGYRPDLAASGADDLGEDAPAMMRNVLVMDVSAVPFVDSTGIGAVVVVLKQVMAHRAGLSIAGAGAQLNGMLRLMGLNKIIVLHPTASAAVHDALGNSIPAR